MLDTDRTLSPTRQMTAAEWRRERERRVDLERLYGALASRLRRLDVEAEIEGAVDRAVAGALVLIPASAEDFRRAASDFYQGGGR